MKFNCEKCNAVYNINESKLPPSGFKFHCKKCSHLLNVKIKKEIIDSRQESDAEIKKASKYEKGNNEQKLSSKTKNRRFFSRFNNKEQAANQGMHTDTVKIHKLMKLISVIDTSSLNKRKIIVCSSIFLIILLIQFQTARNLLFENRIFNAVDISTEEMIDDNLKRATFAFTIARAMNAVISVMQESQLQIEPAGLGVTIAIGEIFDPVNDLIERFSWIMMLSLISLGIMKTLIHISSWLSIDVFLSFGLLFILLGMFVTENKRKLLISVGKKALLGALIIRFAIPVVVHLNHKVYRSVLSTEYETATSEFEHNNRELSELNQNMDENFNTEQESGWFEKIKNAKESLLKIVDLKSKISAVKIVVSNLADTLIKLCVVFLLNTVILPIGFLWLFMKVVRMLFGSQFAVNFEQRLKTKIFQTEKMRPVPAASV